MGVSASSRALEAVRPRTKLAQVDDIVALSTSRRQSPDAVPRLREVFHGSDNETHVSSNQIKHALIS
jgi:hypothetical protein